MDKKTKNRTFKLTRFIGGKLVNENFSSEKWHAAYSSAADAQNIEPTLRRALCILSHGGKILNRPLLCELKNMGLGGEQVLEMYRLMLTVRCFSKEAATSASRPTVLDHKEMPLFISPEGQEAAEVASAYALDSCDWIFWYSRSWGAAIARGVRTDILFKYLYGIPDKEIAKHLLSKKSHLPYILVGNNMTHAAGFAMSRKMRCFSGKQDVVVAYVGDGAMSTPDAHSAMNFAAIHKLPIIFFCENNRIAVSTPLSKQTAVPLVERARGYGIVGEVVDGNDIFAVYYATRKALKRAREQNTPTLIEARTWRQAKHTTAIGVETRSKKEIEKIYEKDPVGRVCAFLKSSDFFNFFDIGFNEKNDLEIKKEISKKIISDTRVRKNLEANTADDKKRNGTIALIDTLGKSAVKKNIALHKNPAINKRYLVNRDEDGTNSKLFEPKFIQDVKCRDAFCIALYDIMRFDPHSVYYGEDMESIGGVFRNLSMHKNFLHTLSLEKFSGLAIENSIPLSRMFCDGRIMDTPLDEYGQSGIAVGLALDGRTVFLESQFSGFVHSMFNHIIAQAARIRQRSAGCLRQSLVFVLLCGGGIPLIEHHREEEISQFLNSPGLVIAYPSTVQDFYDLLWASAASDKPVIFFTHKLLYMDASLRATLRRGIPAGLAIEKIGARITRSAECGENGGVTVATFGKMVETASMAADIAAEYGVPVEIIDLRVLKPLDMGTLKKSISKTGRLVVLHEAPARGGCGSYVLAEVIQDTDILASLLATPRVIGAPECDHPPAPFYKNYIPQTENVAETIQMIYNDHSFI